MVVSVQYRVLPERASDAHYKLTNREVQIKFVNVTQPSAFDDFAVRLARFVVKYRNSHANYFFQPVVVNQVLCVRRHSFHSSAPGAR